MNPEKNYKMLVIVSILLTIMYITALIEINNLQSEKPSTKIDTMVVITCPDSVSVHCPKCNTEISTRLLMASGAEY